MDVIFNELSESIQANNENEADNWMLNLFSLPIRLEKRLHKTTYVRSFTNLGQVFLAPNYTFGQWLHTIKDRDVQRKIIAQLSNKPLLTTDSSYYYQNNRCHGLGFAHEKRTFTISYPKNQWNKLVEIEQEVISVDSNISRVLAHVKNISTLEDIEHYFPTAIFEHHKKHDNKRPNLKDGESTLHYSIPEDIQIVQKLLDCSFGDSKMFNWDEDKKMYIEFQCHLDNKWHGYHIADSTRVPHKVKTKIDEFVKLQ